MSSRSPAPWRALPPVVLLALLGAWTADALKGATPFLDWFGLDPKTFSMEGKVGIAILLLALLCGTVYWLYRIRRVWRLPPRVLEQREGAVSRKVLVVGLSIPPPRIKAFDLGDGKFVELHPTADGLTLSVATVDAALKEMQGHNWQQSLRSIHPHAKEKLELLVIVPSSGDGSGQFINQFRKWLQHYQGTAQWRAFEIQVVDPAVDYEDFKEVQLAYMKAVQLAEEKGFSELDVVIDITAGQKPNSIAAAMVTLTSQVDFQYVQTAKPNKLITYSVVSEGLRDPG
jgi:CRISPR-associated protein (Cas_Cas02710)